MAPNQSDRARAFRALHERPGAFVMPNPWDVGTARILAALGFEALATTSAGLAFALGRRDGEGAVSRDDALAQCRRDRGRDAAAGLGGPGERLRRRAGDGGRDDPSGGRCRSGRRLDRGRYGRSRPPDLRPLARGGAHRGGGRGCPRAALPVHAHRARRELPPWPTRSRRHDPQAAGVRGRGRRRALRAGAARSEHDPHGLCGRSASP